MDKKVKEFKVTSGFYVAKAIDCEIDGDIINALYYVRRAIELEDDDLYLELKLASYYEVMELYEDANDIYLDIVAKNGAVMHCFYALCDNMFYLGDEDAANYYLRQYNNVTDSNEEREEIANIVIKHMRLREKERYGEVPRHVTERDSGKLSGAMAMVRAERYEEAIALIDDIPRQAMDGYGAQRLKMQCLLLLGRVDEAMKEGEDLLTKNAQDPVIIDMMTDAALKKRSGELYAEYIEKQFESKNTDGDAERQSILFLESRGEYEKAFSKCMSYIDEYPYDMTMRRYLGEFCYNTGRFALAEEQFTCNMRVGDYFEEDKYFRTLSRQALERKLTKPKTLIKNAVCLPNAEIERRIQKVKNAARLMSDGIGTEQLWQEEDFITSLRFALGSDYASMIDDANEAEAAAAALSEFDRHPDKRYAKLMEELLMKTRVPDSVKRVLLFHYAYLCEAPSVKFVYDNIFCEVMLDLSAAQLPEIFRRSYAYAVSILGVITRKFEKELKKILHRTAQVYAEKKLNFKRYEALAAAMVSSMNLRVDLSDDAMLCQIFACAKDSMHRYKKELNL